MEEEMQIDPIVVKQSRGERLKRSIFARLRRKEKKQVREVHQRKLAKEAEKKLENFA
jgi:hypothetical protein